MSLLQKAENLRRNKGNANEKMDIELGMEMFSDHYAESQSSRRCLRAHHLASYEGGCRRFSVAAVYSCKSSKVDFQVAEKKSS